MDIFSIIGLLAGVGVLIQGILSNGTLKAFFDVGSIFITIGGTVTALMLNFPMKTLKNFFPAVKKVFFSKSQDPGKIIDTITELAEQARRGGLLSLENKVEEYKDEFLKRCIMTIIDSHDPQTVRDILENELSCIEERHGATQAIFEKGAAFGPAFGMIGTLIGLINMLKMLDDPSSLGPNMSVALVTTFYGSVIANVIFIPMAGKLKVLTQNEIFCKQLIIEGIISVQVGENPRLIREKLLGYLPQNSKTRKNKSKDGDSADAEPKKRVKKAG
jgi:Flagellar motor component